MSSDSNLGGQSVGISLTWAATLVFMHLKLSDNIDWSWWLVFAPVWVEWVLLLVVLGFLGLVSLRSK